MSATIERTKPAKLRKLKAPNVFVPSDYLKRKQVPVRVAGIFLGICLAPLILMLIAAVRLTSPGPGLYRQRRVGLHGKDFVIYKLRSMRQDAESLSGPVWASKRDSRITPIGAFLRWSHLDELPQIINVVRGEMCFVGPRPERPEIIDEIIYQVDGYADRLEAMPGITGIAQVNLPPDQDIDSVRRKVAADRLYIENANLWLDLRLALATLLRIIGIRYHHGARLLGVAITEGVQCQNSDHEAGLLAGANEDLSKKALKKMLEDTHVDLVGADTLVAPNRARSAEKNSTHPIPKSPR